MVESGADRYARAKGSSAKGLMQTIDSTFKEARESLKSQGIDIKDDPFDPRSSIYAGCWYLDRMYRTANENPFSFNRRELSSWEKPLECYYAGPGNGIKDEEWVFVYRDGKRVKINKSVYSQKVLRYARILKKEMEG